MGVEGLENFNEDETTTQEAVEKAINGDGLTEVTPEEPVRQYVEPETGPAAGATPAPHVPGAPPAEPPVYDSNVDETTTEENADFDADEVDDDEEDEEDAA